MCARISNTIAQITDTQILFCLLFTCIVLSWFHVIFYSISQLYRIRGNIYARGRSSYIFPCVIKKSKMKMYICVWTCLQYPHYLFSLFLLSGSFNDTLFYFFFIRLTILHGKRRNSNWDYCFTWSAKMKNQDKG